MIIIKRPSKGKKARVEAKADNQGFVSKCPTNMIEADNQGSACSQHRASMIEEPQADNQGSASKTCFDTCYAV